MTTATMTKGRREKQVPDNIPDTDAEKPAILPQNIHLRDMRVDDFPQQYRVSLTIEIDRPVLDALAGCGPMDAANQRLAEVAANFLATDPGAKEYARLLETRLELVHRKELAEADAEKATAEAKAATTNNLDASDAAAERAEAANKRAVRLDAAIADLDGKIEAAKKATRQGQMKEVGAAAEVITGLAHLYLTTAIAECINRDPARALAVAGVLGGMFRHVYVLKAVTIQEDE
jgi:multidrug efflux pump subunit AcrA (membrane-fusion protein)